MYAGRKSGTCVDGYLEFNKLLLGNRAEMLKGVQLTGNLLPNSVASNLNDFTHQLFLDNLLAGYTANNAARTGDPASAAFGGLLILAGFVGAFVASLLTAKLQHGIYNKIPEGYRNTPPSQLVGFLFIPVFNLYWTFKSYGTLAKSFSKYATANEGTTIENQKTLATIHSAASIIYYISLILIQILPFAVIIHTITFHYFFKKMNGYAKVVEKTTVKPD